MSLSRWFTYSLICIFFPLLQAHADILKYPDQDPKVMLRESAPQRGMTKTQVQSRYGEPLKQNPAVGNPPISSWDYADYTVFFELDRVLHTVVHKKTKDH